MGMECDEAGVGDLVATKDALRGRDYARVHFEIHVAQFGTWFFGPRHLYGRRMMTERLFDPAKAVRVRDRLVATFRDGKLDQITPAGMLSPNCMICGKGLTDPASMARMIGPECYGSGSLDIPWLYQPQAEVVRT